MPRAPFPLFVIQSSWTAAIFVKATVFFLSLRRDGPLPVLPLCPSLSSSPPHSNWRDDQLTSARSNGTDGSALRIWRACHLNFTREIQWNIMTANGMDAWRSDAKMRWRDMTRCDAMRCDIAWLDPLCGLIRSLDDSSPRTLWKTFPSLHFHFTFLLLLCEKAKLLTSLANEWQHVSCKIAALLLSINATGVNGGQG